jgi:hypothetical protein
MDGESVESAYDAIRNYNACKLVKECIHRYHSCSPSNLISDDVWATFYHAIKYRNLLIHECTFLKQDYSKQLIKATIIIFEKISEFANCNQCKRTDLT